LSGPYPGQPEASSEPTLALGSSSSFDVLSRTELFHRAGRRALPDGRASHWQMYVVLFQVDFANAFVTPLQLQHWPARLVLLILAHPAMQVPVLVLLESFKPYVGSIATRLPLTCCAMNGFRSAPVKVCFPPTRINWTNESLGACKGCRLGCAMSYQ
jgi:hypothetical protein